MVVEEDCLGRKLCSRANDDGVGARGRDEYAGEEGGGPGTGGDDDGVCREAFSNGCKVGYGFCVKGCCTADN